MLLFRIRWQQRTLDKFMFYEEKYWDFPCKLTVNFDHRKIVPGTNKRLASAPGRFARSCCLDSLIGLQVLEQVWTYKQLGTERVESDEKDIIKTRKARDRGNKTQALITMYKVHWITQMREMYRQTEVLGGKGRKRKRKCASRRKVAISGEKSETSYASSCSGLQKFHTTTTKRRDKRRDSQTNTTATIDDLASCTNFCTGPIFSWREFPL